MWVFENPIEGISVHKLWDARIRYITDRVKHLSKHHWHFNSMQKSRVEASSAALKALLASKNIDKLASSWMKIGREMDAILIGMDDVNDVREDREDIQESPIANFDVCGCCCIVSLCDFQRCLRSPEALDATWSSCGCRIGVLRRCWIMTIAMCSFLVVVCLGIYVGMWSMETKGLILPHDRTVT